MNRSPTATLPPFVAQRDRGFAGLVGVGRADVTPSLEVFARCWGAGEADRMFALHRSLTATVLAVASRDHPSRPLILVALDASWWQADDERPFRDELLRRFSLGESQLLISLSHSHAAPPLNAGLTDKPGGEELANYIRNLPPLHRLPRRLLALPARPRPPDRRSGCRPGHRGRALPRWGRSGRLGIGAGPAHRRGRPQRRAGSGGQHRLLQCPSHSLLRRHRHPAFPQGESGKALSADLCSRRAHAEGAGEPLRSEGPRRRGQPPRLGFSVYFMEKTPQNWREIAEQHDFAFDTRYRKALVENGVFHFPLPTKQGSISTAHDEAIIDQTLEITEATLKQL